MTNNLTILVLLALMTISCNPDSKNVSQHVEKIASISQHDDDSTHLILLSEFQDHLMISCNNKIIADRNFETNPSTGSCKPEISFWPRDQHSDTLTFKNASDSVLHQIVINGRHKYLYVWRIDNFWQHQYRDDALELE